jgi:opacity protein-like surface antigen
MKKFFAILVVAILATSFSFAQTHNDWVTTHANFDIAVIQPLTWTKTADVDLGAVITGFVKPIVASITFTLQGEFTYGNTPYDVDINGTGPDPVDGVVLNGVWTGTGTNIQLDPTGNAVVVYTTTNVDAVNATSNGTKVFTINVDAKYSNL